MAQLAVTVRIGNLAMIKHLTTFACLVAAILFYWLGAAVPATVLIVVGMVAEGIFWLRLLRGRTTKDA